MADRAQEERLVSPAQHYTIFLNGVVNVIGPGDEREWMLAESLVRADYERCNPGDRFDDLKKRARFSKEDQGLLRDWMALAARRAAERDGSGKTDRTPTNATRANGKRNRIAA
ncbi:MAG: hypothetical protein EPN45_02285 [Rhizobiaceae bacterium]|nr:MAG: hypothetical protein EPN45_02285 [Rhizobiaceae bacterium]